MPRVSALLVAPVVLLSIVFAPGVPSVAAGTAASPSATGIRWRACGHSFECGGLLVPVDYGNPAAGTVRIAVTRARARDPRRRIGSLVVNFGGPGDPGATSVRSFVGDVPGAIRDRYDIVGFDPRGTGHSDPIDCLSNAEEDTLNAVDPTPSTTAQLRAFYNGTYDGIDVVRRCVDRYGSWLARVGTRNVARDLDALRAALGDARLTFLGYSYGTAIGAVYAQQFPERVGRLVLDGAVDLSESQTSEAGEDAAGFEHALDQFLADCARRSGCDFHSGGRPSKALATLRDRFERGLTLPTYRDDGQRQKRRAGVGAFYTALVSALYDRQYGWPELAASLALAEHGDGSGLLALADEYNGRSPDGTYDSLAESSGVILCADSPDPMETFDQFVKEYRQASRDYPFLGAALTDTPTGCDPRLPRPSDGELLG
ncbi:MAG TPA: alpha/beta fold hydrolase, partial [Acidimicrobiia bacterium]|nr:alpha/beta fold hydrolase [Acidimicrobiia bacterium]